MPFISTFASNECPVSNINNFFLIQMLLKTDFSPPVDSAMGMI